ncbi:MAG TPA: hypothetical protein PK341_06995 [Spirochaetota bacterium]|nr:hypothetical protein [Spirochaetota bacterium]
MGHELNHELREEDVHAEARRPRRKIIIRMGKGPGQSVIPAHAGIHLDA